MRVGVVVRAFFPDGVGPVALLPCCRSCFDPHTELFFHCYAGKNYTFYAHTRLALSCVFLRKVCNELRLVTGSGARQPPGNEQHLRALGCRRRDQASTKGQEINVRSVGVKLHTVHVLEMLE